MANCRQGHARDPPGNMHSRVFCLLTAREWGGACTSWIYGRSDARPITGVLPFLTFLSLTLSKGIFTSHQMSRIVGPILRFFEIGFSPKMEQHWAVPPTIITTYTSTFITIINNHITPPIAMTTTSHSLIFMNIFVNKTRIKRQIR